MIEAQVQTSAHGAILFDAGVAAHADEAWFDPVTAAIDPAASRRRAGRGTVITFETPFGACVLRHYRRGGMAARISADRYLWTGRERTRGFREFRLLASLHDAGLRVPAPVAARYRREDIRYRADLVTRLIPDARTLADDVVAGTLDAGDSVRIGRTLAGFHAKGAWHADLNAHNILLDARGEVWLLDFDRGRLRAPEVAWQQANLARLLRSLTKLDAPRRVAGFDSRFWQPLLAEYHEALAGRERAGDGQ